MQEWLLRGVRQTFGRYIHGGTWGSWQGFTRADNVLVTDANNYLAGGSVELALLELEERLGDDIKKLFNIKWFATDSADDGTAANFDLIYFDATGATLPSADHGGSYYLFRECYNTFKRFNDE